MAESSTSSGNNNGLIIGIVSVMGVALVGILVWTYMKTKKTTDSLVAKLDNSKKPATYGSTGRVAPVNPNKPQSSSSSSILNNVGNQAAQAGTKMLLDQVGKRINQPTNAGATKNPKNTKKPTTKAPPADKITKTDPITGAYQENGTDWYLADGTPLYYYDERGAYQEEDGTWYLFDGTELMDYDISSGSYQELDKVWYDLDGKPIATKVNDKYGAYQESDGTWYLEDGTALSYFNEETGEYSEEGDWSGTIYDADGNPIEKPTASNDELDYYGFDWGDDDEESNNQSTASNDEIDYYSMDFGDDDV